MGFDFKGAVKKPQKALDLSKYVVTDSDENTITQLEIELLDEFEGQPFKSYTKEALDELAASIECNGVLQPIVCVRKDDGRYTILAGHNRVRACRQLGYAQIKAVVYRELSKAEQVLVMTDTNLSQRQKLSIKEKALAYKMRYEAAKELGKEYSTKDVAEETGESKRTVQRYLSCAKLPEKLLDKVDSGSFTLKTGAVLGMLDKDSKEALAEYVTEHQKVKIDDAKAQEIKEYEAEKGEALTNDDYEDMFETKLLQKKKVSQEIKIKYSDIADIFCNVDIHTAESVIRTLILSEKDKIAAMCKGYDVTVNEEKTAVEEDVSDFEGYEMDEDVLDGVI